MHRFEITLCIGSLGFPIVENLERVGSFTITLLDIPLTDKAVNVKCEHLFAFLVIKTAH
jgi:hypothetical protein